MSSNPFEKIDPVVASVLQTTHRDVRLRIEAALRSDPQRADRQLSRELEVKRTAISSIRAALEAQGQIPARPSLFRVVR